MGTRVDLHVLVPNRDGSAFLATTDGRLPATSLDLPPDRPAIGAVAAFVRSEMAIDSPVLELSLRWDTVDEGDPIPGLAVVEPPPGSWRPQDGLAWLPLAGGPPELPASIRGRADQLIKEIRAGSPPPPLRPRWARPGWYGRATAWATAELSAVGRPPTGRFEQTYLRGFSALLRAPTASGDVYLKAVFPLFHHEPLVTALIRDRIPEATPTILAIEPDEGWLLMDDLGGEAVRETGGEVGLRLGARALVGIQRRLAGDLEPFRSAGCPERPLGRLADDLAAAFREPAAPTGRTPERIATIVAHIVSAAGRVAGIGLPESIIHGDFHNGNVVVRDGQAVIFDWSDAALGNPVVDLVTWLWELETEASRETAIDGWIEAWADHVGPAAVRDCLDDILAVGAAYQVVSYVGILRELEPESRYSLGDAFAMYVDQLDGAVPG